MLSKSLVQFSVDGQGCVASLCFDPRPSYGEDNEGNGISFRRSHAALPHSALLTQQQATSNPRLHCRLLDIHRQVWVSLFWGHCSFLLGPGAHKFSFVPFKSLFPQSYISSVIKSHWSPKSNSLGVHSPFARLGNLLWVLELS